MREKNIQPQVCIVPLERVLPHEMVDPRRVERLKADLLSDGVLKDPPIAAQHNGSFIILDGATRTQTLRELDAAHIIIQVVTYEEPMVRLDTWSHLLMDVSHQEVCERVQAAAQTPGHPVQPGILRERLNDGLYSFGIYTVAGTAFGYNGSNDHRHRIDQLNRVVEVCQELGDIYRSDEHDVSILQAMNPKLSVVITYPIFRPADIIQCVLDEVQIPAGITRHLIDGRVLGLNFPLEMLMDQGSLDVHNRHLHDQVEGGSFKKTHARNGETLLQFSPEPTTSEPRRCRVFDKVDGLAMK
jgi:hypothetical protein